MPVLVSRRVRNFEIHKKTTQNKKWPTRPTGYAYAKSCSQLSSTISCSGDTNSHNKCGKGKDVTGSRCKVDRNGTRSELPWSSKHGKWFWSSYVTTLDTTISSFKRPRIISTAYICNTYAFCSSIF